MAGREAGENRDAKRREELRQQCGNIALLFRLVALVVGETAQQNASERLQFAGQPQLREIAVDPVEPFAHVFQEQNAAGRFDLERRSQHAGTTRPGCRRSAGRWRRRRESAASDTPSTLLMSYV